MSPKVRRLARYALATIRLINGIGALFVPKQLSKRIGIEITAEDHGIYILRLFGIRTILLGADLLVTDGERLDRALKAGVLIHTSDALSAAIAGAGHQLPKRAAIMATVISTVNATLAVVAMDRDR